MLKKYAKTIEQINQIETDYLNIRREYDKREFEIICNFDFRAEYGKDNEKIRKGHIRNELSDLLLKKDAIKLEMDKLNRQKTLLELEILYGGE